jgi:hypothetical protein
MRYILEGTWTGYVSRQSRVCHREVITAKRAAILKGLHKIVFTDGTALIIDIREAGYREKIVTNNQYGELIRDAERHGGNVVMVADLCKKETAA